MVALGAEIIEKHFHIRVRTWKARIIYESRTMCELAQMDSAIRHGRKKVLAMAIRKETASSSIMLWQKRKKREVRKMWIHTGEFFTEKPYGKKTFKWN